MAVQIMIRIMRIAVEKVDSKLMDYKDNSGFFFEVDKKKDKEKTIKNSR